MDKVQDVWVQDFQVGPMGARRVWAMHERPDAESVEEFGKLHHYVPATYADKLKAELESARYTMERRMKSDRASERRFDEDLAEAIARIDKLLGKM